MTDLLQDTRAIACFAVLVVVVGASLLSELETQRRRRIRRTRLNRELHQRWKGGGTK